MSQHHHDHVHPHPHEPISDHGREPRPEYRILEQAMRELLIEKGVVTADEWRRQIELMDSRNAAMGAKIVARAWVDPGYRKRLLADAKIGRAHV